MTRLLDNWLTTYIDYASVTEAPRSMHFWTGVSVLAGALRRKVWIDMVRFQWFPSFYVIFVAPPGVVSKTTTADVGMSILRDVPGINFGPDIITWPSLVQAFASSGESFQMGEDWLPMSAMTLVAGELGNLINPQDREMLNLYITLWDGVKRLDKSTKTSGSDTIEAPWINILGCTTPHWIADNMPAAAVGGGFTSRCIFVYADAKVAYVPYVDEVVHQNNDVIRQALVHDLEHISTTMCGPFVIEEEARVWGREWYEKFWRLEVPSMNNQLMEGYAARKQTHLHKTAMMMSAARSDDRRITREDLILADMMLTGLEPDMIKVFSRIGRTEESLQTERFLDFVKKNGYVPYAKAYQHIHFAFPDFHNFEAIVTGCIRAGYISNEQNGTEFWLRYIKKD